MVPNSPEKVDFLGAKHLVYHAAVMMTTATSFEINTHISPSDAFYICLNARKRDLRSFNADSGDVVSIDLLSFKRLFAMKFIRTALFKLYPNLNFRPQKASTRKFGKSQRDDYSSQK